MLNTHNLYPLQEVKSFRRALMDLGIKRPLIFSRAGFTGSHQYAGKWIGHFSGWKGLEMAIRNTMKFNVRLTLIIN
jgi:alpha-glucosidase (family GH31 glycosyl hydrolase)